MKRKSFAVLIALVLSVAIPASLMAQTTALQARDTALELTQGGVVMGLNQVNEGGQPLHHVTIDNNVRFDVFISVGSGDVVRVATSQIPGQAAGQATGQQNWQTAPAQSWSSPSPRRAGMPANPAISRDAAINIAHNFLTSNGFAPGQLRSAHMDWERGRWVWEVEFRNGRIEYEFYIDVNTGEIVKFEID